LLGKREGYAIDLEAVIRAAAESGTALEINGQPDRLDLDDTWARRAKEAGVVLMLSTDAHAVGHFAPNMRYAVATARRGWVEARNVLNAMPIAELQRWRKRTRLPAA
jgi:DNA polymerase (family 10)